MLKTADNIVTKLIPLKRIWGVHIWDGSDSDCFAYAVLIENIKGTVIVKETLEFDIYKNLPEDKFKDIPVCLSYDSPKVLVKSITEDQVNSIAESMHIKDIDDFYVQTGTLTDGFFNTIVRKDHMDKCLSMLTKGDFNVISVTLGAINFKSCLPYIDNRDSQELFRVGNYEIHAGEEDVVTIIRKVTKYESDASISIGNQPIPNQFILSYCNVLSSLLYNGEEPYLIHKPKSVDVLEYKYGKLYQKLVPICLGLLLGILSINFLLNQHYSEKQNQYNEEYSSYQLAHKKFQLLKVQFDEQKKIFGQLEYVSHGYFSYYADRIAHLIERRVNLTSLVIHPYHEKIDQTNKSFVYTEGAILIKGTCNNPVEMNQWMRDLKNESFVKGISDHVYEYDDKIEAGRFSFLLRVEKP